MSNRLVKLYRQLLQESKQIKDCAVRERTINEIKDICRRKNVDTEKLVKLCESKLSYIKVVSDKKEFKKEKVRFIMKNGKLIETNDKLNENKAYKSSIDPDDLQKHKYLMERQHFMHRK